MKILFVIDTFYTSNNGTSISAQRYCSELRKRGHEVRVMCGDKPHTKEEAQITSGDFCTGVFHFPIFQPLCEKNGFLYANWTPSIVEQACNWADIVHVFTPFFLCNAAIRYCNKIGKPVTAAFHIQPENITSNLGVAWFEPFNKMIYRIFARTTYNRVRHVHTPSQLIANIMRKNGYTADIHVISNGINDDFIEAGKDRSFVAENPTDRLIKIMMIGRLSREKRQDLIINAMQYSKYANRIQLVFAGKGPRYQFLRQLGDKLMIKPQFLYLNRQQLIDELMTTDLYIHASDMESEAISCIEAFATGLVPVIANSPKSATPQFALDGRSLFKAGNPKDLARTIDYWLDRPQERAMMANKYRTSARKYSLSNSVAIFESMLRKEIGIDESQLLRRKIA
jgi:glycosyltransferase involved in cell wall biosynthesis